MHFGGHKLVHNVHGLQVVIYLIDLKGPSTDFHTVDLDNGKQAYYRKTCKHAA
jgi:hypothetical protein